MMKAVVLHAPNTMQYEDIPVPSVGPGMVKVRVRAAGICGSDVPRVLEGTARKYPIVQGHEFTGDIVEVAPDVTTLKVGDRISGAAHLPCYACDDCAQGNYGSCQNYSFIGSLVNGAFADYIVLPSQNAVKCSPNISYEQAVLFEPCTVAMHALRSTGYRGGEDVAVLGAGTVGIFVVQCAKALGAKRVTVFDIDPFRLQLALDMGADCAVNTKEPDFMEQALAATGGKGYHFIYEVAGQPATMQMIFGLAATHGTVGFIGYPHVPVTFQPGPWEQIILKELTFIGCRLSYSAPFPGPAWTLTEKFFADGRLRIDPRMIDRRFNMCDASRAFDLFRTPGTVKGKILLVNDLPL